MSGFIYIGALDLTPYIIRDINLANGRFFEFDNIPTQSEKDLFLIFKAFNNFADAHREMIVITDKGRFRPHSAGYRIYPDDSSRYTLSAGGIYVDLFKKTPFWREKRGGLRL